MKRLLFIVGFYFIFGCNCIYAQSKINAYEYWYDDNYQGAIFTNIIPVIELNLNSNFSTNLLNTGLHRIHFRFRDINNKWSCIISQLFYKANSFTFPNKINRYRFWFDNFDNIKTEIDIIPPITQKELSLSISPGNLPIGMHRVHFQFRDIENIWSVVTTDTFSNAGCSAPTIQTSELSFSSVDYTQMTVNWINGNGSRRIIKINTVNSFTDPSNGTDPPANSSYSGFGEQVIYSNDGNSVNITGLNSNTTYWFRVYEANCTGSSSLYNFTLASNNPRSQTTLSSCVSPTIQASNLSFTSVGANQITVNWQNGDGNRRVVLMNTINSFTAPLNGTDPSSNSTYNGSGEQVVYNGAGSNISINGLTANTTYWFRVYEANCNGNTSLYNITTGSNNPKSQITLSSCIAPSIQASNISFPSVGTTQMTVKWIIGNGSRRTVKINTVNSFTAPLNATDPVANSTYSGVGEQVVYNGNSDNVNVTGLTANTTYWFRVYEANCNGSSSLYNISTSSENPKSQVTQTSTFTYWIGAYTRPENYPQFTYDKLLISTTTYSSPTSPFLKICADGSNATIIKLNCDNPAINMKDIRFKVNSDPNHNNSNLYGEFKDPNSYFSTNTLAQVRFTHPNYLDNNYPSYRDDIIIAFNVNDPTVNLLTLPIRIYRAPVLFVHGLWGDNTSFVEMENAFKLNFGNSNIVTCRADYKKTNDKSFSENSDILPNWMYTILNKGRNDSFSCGKVDVISHSMGGILTRIYLQSKNYKNDLHTLTTINSPHAGTQGANLLRSNLGFAIGSIMSLTGRNMYGGAVSDLKINSPEYQKLNVLNSRKVPTLIYTSNSTYIFDGVDWVPLSTIFYEYELLFLSLFIKTPLELAQSLYSSPSEFDAIVPVASQSGGLNYQPFDNITHTQAEKNPDIWMGNNSIFKKLGSNPLSSTFNQNDFQPAQLHLPLWFFPPLVIQFKIIPDSIKINKPINNSIYNVGDTVNFQISRVSGNENFLGFILTNQDQPIYNKDTVASTINYQYIIPNKLFGRVNVIAFGLNNSNSYDIDSLFFIVKVKANLDSLKSDSDTLLIPLNKYKNIDIQGFYDDSIIRDISVIPGIVYSVLDTNIVSFSQPNSLFAKQLGNTKVVVNYYGFIDTLNIKVYNEPNYNYSSFTVTKNIVCGNEDVQYSDQSGGFPLSWKWKFPGGFPDFSTDKNPVINYDTPGFYDVQLITTWSDKIDTLNVQSYITVTTNPNASIIALGSTNICFGQSVQLNANSGVSLNYLWNTKETSQNIIVNSSGTFSVIVIDSLGCSSVSNPLDVVIYSIPKPIITNVGSNSICQGDSIKLTSSFAYSYLWNTGASTESITVHDPGNYMVTITDSIGCSATSLVTTLIENSIINLTFLTNNESSSGALDGSATVYPTGGSGPYSYLWNNSNNATSQSVNGLAAGNYSVTVTDLNTGCKSLGSVIVQLSNSSSNFTISGNISVPATNQNVGLVEVEMSGTNVSSQTTNNTGNYSLTAPAFSNVTVKPFKDFFPTNGVTGLDLAIIQQHITNPNTPTLITPYQLIAADCNNDGLINGIDLAVGQALILGNISSLPNNTSWVFVPKSYIFSNPLNPFTPPYSSSLSYPYLSSDNLNQDYWGIKIGDVQYSASPTLANGGNEVRDYVDELNFVTYDKILNKGATIQPDFTSDNFNDILAYQFTLEADPDYLEILEPSSGVLPGMNQDYFGMNKSNEGLLTSVWYNNTGYNLFPKENAFGLSLKVKKGGKKLSECLKLSDKEILTTAYNSYYKPIEIGLKFLSDVKIMSQYTFELYQNQPNPFKNTTTISFSLPEAERATIQILDLNGKLIKSIEKNFEKGINREEVKLENVSQGIYYYKVSTSEHSAIRKMVVLD